MRVHCREKPRTYSVLDLPQIAPHRVYHCGQKARERVVLFSLPPWVWAYIAGVLGSINDSLGCEAGSTTAARRREREGVGAPLRCTGAHMLMGISPKGGACP